VVESGRHHADDLDCLSVELNFSAYDARITSKTPRPKTVAQDDHVISAWFEFFGFEYATVGRCDSQNWKEVGCCGNAGQTFCCLTLFGEITADEVVGGQLLEDRVLGLVVKEICC
jgi:hypothetical protein